MASNPTPAVMRAARLSAPEKIEIVDLPLPSATPGDVVISVAAAGICGSDMHAWRGHHPFRRPTVILGHEVSGTIVAVGDGVPADRIGQRVVVEPQRICGACSHCIDGRNELCGSRVLPGMNGWTGAIADLFAAPASMTHPIPDSLDLELAVLAEPLAVAVHALTRGGLQSGERVNVIGAGAIGALVTAVAHAWQAEVGIVTDIDTAKLAFIRTLGAAEPVDVRDGAFWNEPLTRDRQADVTVVAATAPDSLVEATALTRAGGRIVLLGLYGDRAEIAASRLVTEEQTIVASVTYDSTDFRTAVELLDQNPERFATLITRRIGFSELAGEFHRQATGAEFGVKTIILPALEPAHV